MICDGHQTIAFFCLNTTDLTVFQAIMKAEDENQSGIMTASPMGFQFAPQKKLNSLYNWRFINEKGWQFDEWIGFHDTIYIIGGGHVGLALSEIMNRLGFYVNIVDDRLALNTMENNLWAHKKLQVCYDNIDQYIPEKDSPYVALMSFGYRTDHKIIRKLIGKNFKYLGVMESRVKMKKLLTELVEEGFNQEDLDKIHTPIGINIGSKTPIEIAISVAAEIISIKHRKL